MLYTSPSPDINIPDSNWPDYFIHCLEQFQHQPALVAGETDRRLSYSELKNSIYAFASALQQRGYQKGDVIAIYSPNSLEFIIAFHAILTIGAVVTPANPMYTASELVHQLDNANAKCLLTTAALYEKVASALADTGVRDTILLNLDATAVAPVSAISELLAQGRGQTPTAVAITPSDLAVLPFSSGTTGLPKGVMLSHQALVSHDLILAGQRGASVPDSSDRILATLPLFHIYGLSVVMSLGLTHGACIVVMSRFEPTLFLELLQKHHISRTYLVPPIMLFLAKSPAVDNYDLSTLKYICSGAAPLGAELATAVAERLDCCVVQGYGMTEMSPATHFTPDLGTIKPASIGVLIPNTKALLIDPQSGSQLGPNENGELLVTGPQMMLGYLNNPEATANTIDANGWLHTGDIAYADEDGYFYIVDRLKEFIKYKGYQIAPAELEAVLLSHPSIADAAVVPFPDAEAGEIPKAFVVSSAAISGDEIMAWLAEKVAPFKKVRALEFVEQIPKSPSGKILRRLLKQPPVTPTT